MIMNNRNSIPVSNKELENNQKINRDLLIFNQFHKNANLPYLECAQNNLKKDNKNSTIINNHSFLRPQRAVLGINPMLDNSINSNKHEVRTNILNTKKSNEKKEFQNDIIPLNIYRNFSSSTRISKKKYSNYDMNQRNLYK